MPKVDPDHAAGLGQRLVLLDTEHDEPLTALTLDGDGLDPAGHRAVLVDLHMPDALEADPGDRVVRGGVPAAAVPVLREVHRVEPVHPAKARIAGRLPGLDAAEERLHRLVQAAQGGLLRGERPAALTLRVERPDLLQLRGLHPVPDGALRDVPPAVAAFL
jgi:hypothetical protein